MKILLIGVNTTGLVLPIAEEMRKQGHDVIYLENGEISSNHYINKTERLANLLSKALLGQNLKRQRSQHASSQYLKGFTLERHFDLTIITNPDIYTKEHLALLKSVSGKLVCHLWDSIDRMPGNLRQIDIFDKVVSFDPKDIKQYAFTEVSNYYHGDKKPLVIPKQYQGDLFGIFSYDKERYALILKLLDVNPELKCKIIILADHKRKQRQANDPRIEVVLSPILGEQLQQMSSQYKAVLDVGYTSQQGLSFRFFDALAYEQKLVSNNTTVKNYPFYNANNIYCISEGKLDVPTDFFSSAYHKVDENIKQQYRLDCWVTNLLKIMIK